MSHKIFPSFSASPPSGTPRISLSPLPGGSTGGNSLFQFQGPNVTANPKIINVRNVRNPLAPGGGGSNRRNKNTHFINPYLAFLLNSKSPIIPNNAAVPAVKNGAVKTSQEKSAMSMPPPTPPLPPLPPLPLPPSSPLLPLPDLDSPEGPSAPLQPSSPVSFFLPIPSQINNYQLFDPEKLEMWDKIKKDLKEIKKQKDESESTAAAIGRNKMDIDLPELKLQLTDGKVRIKKSDDENFLRKLSFSNNFHKKASLLSSLGDFYRSVAHGLSYRIPHSIRSFLGKPTADQEVLKLLKDIEKLDPKDLELMLSYRGLDTSNLLDVLKQYNIYPSNTTKIIGLFRDLAKNQNFKYLSNINTGGNLPEAASALAQLELLHHLGQSSGRLDKILRSLPEEYLEYLARSVNDLKNSKHLTDVQKNIVAGIKDVTEKIDDIVGDYMSRKNMAKLVDPKNPQGDVAEKIVKQKIQDLDKEIPIDKRFSNKGLGLTLDTIQDYLKGGGKESIFFRRGKIILPTTAGALGTAGVIGGSYLLGGDDDLTQLQGGKESGSGFISDILTSVPNFIQSSLSSPETRDAIGSLLGVGGLAGITYGLSKSLFGKKKKRKNESENEKYSSDRHHENKTEFHECKTLLSYHKWLEKITRKYDKFNE
jgi:hypothetical protein